MGTHIQRKRIDNLEEGGLILDGYANHAKSGPGAEITAEVIERGGELWIYVTTEGHLVTGLEDPLPEYERVSG